MYHKICVYICTDQLNKIDDDMKKLLNDKLNILQAMQGGVRDYRSTDSTPKHVPAKELDTPKAIVEAAIEQGIYACIWSCQYSSCNYP